MEVPSKRPELSTLPPSISGRQIKELWGIADKAFKLLISAPDFPKRDTVTRMYYTIEVENFLKAHHLI